MTDVCSSYPKNVSTHAQFSFMDLVHPEDRAMVMRMWNTVVEGSPVAFEMRWKLRNDSITDDSGNWVLASCVPIFDDEKVVCSVAGNIIDIDAQRKSQKAAQAQLEALEQVRLSEMKFARFAELSPTAIYIFVPGTGKCEAPRMFLEADLPDRDAVRQRPILRTNGPHASPQ
jgi:hypothetical protein